MIIRFILCFLLIGAAQAQDRIITAEELALSHSLKQATAIGESLGVVIYDGPSDGETPFIPCNVIPGNPHCVEVMNLLPTIGSVLSPRPESTQTAEDYLYYHAFRNVQAGYYVDRSIFEWVRDTGVGAAIFAEIQLLRSGERPLTLLANDPTWAGYIETAKENLQ